MSHFEQAVMSLYAATGLNALGLRSPSLSEAELADGEIIRGLNTLLSDGFTLDAALHELVVVRNTLHTYLQPKPKLPVPLPQSKGMKRRREDAFARWGCGSSSSLGVQHCCRKARSCKGIRKESSIDRRWVG